VDGRDKRGHDAVKARLVNLDSEPCCLCQRFELGFSFLSAVMPGPVPGIHAGTSRNASRGGIRLMF
jgi:hypothetical protein